MNGMTKSFQLLNAKAQNHAYRAVSIFSGVHTVALITDEDCKPGYIPFLSLAHAFRYLLLLDKKQVTGAVY